MAAKLLVALIGAMALFTASAAAQTADKVFTNASVLTMNDKAPTAEAVAVQGNKIIFVGSADDVKQQLREKGYRDHDDDD